MRGGDNALPSDERPQCIYLNRVNGKILDVRESEWHVSSDSLATS